MKYVRTILIVVGSLLLTLITIGLMSPQQQGATPHIFAIIVWIAAYLAIFLGYYLWICLKSRSIAWILTGFLGPISLVVLAKLEDRSMFD